MLRPFDHDSSRDLDLLRDWRLARGEIMPHSSWLPDGFFWEEGRLGPIAVGFGYLASGRAGAIHLDWFATKPGLTPGKAQDAIDQILGGLETLGNTLFPGPFVMLGCVQSDAMANRARKSGFTPLGITNMIAKVVENQWQQQHLQSSPSLLPQ